MIGTQRTHLTAWATISLIMALPLSCCFASVSMRFAIVVGNFKFNWNARKLIERLAEGQS